MEFIKCGESQNRTNHTNESPSFMPNFLYSYVHSCDSWFLSCAWDFELRIWFCYCRLGSGMISGGGTAALAAAAGGLGRRIARGGLGTWAISQFAAAVGRAVRADDEQVVAVAVSLLAGEVGADRSPVVLACGGLPGAPGDKIPRRPARKCRCRAAAASGTCSKGWTRTGVTRTTNSCSPELRLSTPPVRPMIGRSPQNGTRFDVAAEIVLDQAGHGERLAFAEFDGGLELALGNLARHRGPADLGGRRAGGRYAGVQLQADAIAVGNDRARIAARRRSSGRSRSARRRRGERCCWGSGRTRRPESSPACR